MAAMTTTRPTIVRTTLPPPAPTWAALPPAVSPSRFSGVCSPFAPSATAGTSMTPQRAAVQAGMSAGIRIAEGDPGSGSPSLSAARRPPLPPVFEPQLVHDGAAEQDDRQHVEPD